MSGLVQIGSASKGRDLTYGSSEKPNNRAPFARSVVVVTSGKGGVGKTTVAVNLAVAAAQKGLRVGLLDADVYGPSVPRMLQLHEEKLRWNDANHMVPSENFGVKVVSAGQAAPEADTPMAWRSSVATSALIQLLEDVDWGPLDILFVDLPPGTGDVQLTVAQELHLTAAVMVTTPQMVATDDVRRAIRMMQDMRVNVAGVVENMAAFVAPDTGRTYHPFGQGGGRRLCEEYQVPFLGELPFTDATRICGDEGTPVVATGTPAEKAAFQAILTALLEDPAMKRALAPDTAAPVR